MVHHCTACLSDSSCRRACSWMCHISANVAAVSAVAFSAWKIWPLGMALSISYSSVLWWMVQRYDSRVFSKTSEPTSITPGDTANAESITPADTANAENITPADTANAESITPGDTANAENITSADTANAETMETAEEGQAPGTPRTPTLATPHTLHKYPLALSLVYLLAVLSLGFPGMILTYQVFPCQEVQPSDDQYWTTPNASLLPKELSSLHVLSDYDNNRAFYGAGSKFCLLGSTLYFPGSQTTEGAPTLYASSGETSPRQVHSPGQVNNFYFPRWLTKVNEDTMCFSTNPHWSRNQAFHELWCGNESEFRKLDSSDWGDNDVATRLAAIDGLLWFRRVNEDVGGYAIVSLNTTTMKRTLHSELRQNYKPTESWKASSKYPEEHNCVRNKSMARALAVLFLVALPITIASGILWWKKGVPSSSISLFFGIFLIAMFDADGSVPLATGAKIGLLVWLWVVVPGWIIFGALLLAVNPRAAGPPLIWSWNALLFTQFVTWSNAYISGSVSYYGFLYGVNPGLFAFMSFVFSMVIGLVANSTLVIVLGVLGMIIAVAALQQSESVFLVALEVMGLLLLGWFIYRRKDTGHIKLAALVRQCIRLALAWVYELIKVKERC